MTPTIYCGIHSRPGAGVFVFACGISCSLAADCPCMTGDRYVVVDEAPSGAGWRQAADVVICLPQRCLSTASRAADAALTELPGCTLAVARFDATAGVLRTRESSVELLLTNDALRPERLADRVHHWHVQRSLKRAAGTPSAGVPPR